MFRRLMEKFGFVEVVARRFATAFKPIKRFLKRSQNNKKKGTSIESSEKSLFLFKETLASLGILPGDVIIIHSSMDGLRTLGLSASEIIDLILEVFKGSTILFAAFPVEPKRTSGTFKYNPNKTFCWTGMIPNEFLKRDQTKRTLFPFNSLASYGPLTETILKDNLLAVTPHGKNSAWYRCYEFHAKLLFLGTTSRESNTMAIHMIPDIMDDCWPVDGWYEKRNYLIETGSGPFEKDILIQKGLWYRYVNEYKTDRILKDAHLLIDVSTPDVIIECVPDCHEMVRFLMDRCQKGKLMYSIPKRYFKRRNGNAKSSK